MSKFSPCFWSFFGFFCFISETERKKKSRAAFGLFLVLISLLQLGRDCCCRGPLCLASIIMPGGEAERRRGGGGALDFVASIASASSTSLLGGPPSSSSSSALSPAAGGARSSSPASNNNPNSKKGKGPLSFLLSKVTALPLGALVREAWRRRRRTVELSGGAAKAIAKRGKRKKNDCSFSFCFFHCLRARFSSKFDVYERKLFCAVLGGQKQRIPKGKRELAKREMNPFSALQSD